MLPTYIQHWLTIIDEMSNDNTYKMAWGRALIECVHNREYTEEENVTVVSFDNISPKILRYYWNQIFFFNLKQSPYKDKEPVICQITKDLINFYKRSVKKAIPVWFDDNISFFKKHQKEYDSAIKKISTTLHQNVAYRFKNVSQGKTLDVYRYEKGVPEVRFTKEESMCLFEYAVILSRLLNYKWTQKLEQFNYAPKIASKVKSVSDSKIRRNNLKKYKDELLKEFEGGDPVDFYTGEPLSLNDISVDHVIPWSFMYSDDIWNMVLTSKSNNSSKSNSIPTEDMIKRLKLRNEKLISIIDDWAAASIEEANVNGLVDRYYYECMM